MYIIFVGIYISRLLVPFSLGCHFCDTQREETFSLVRLFSWGESRCCKLVFSRVDFVVGFLVEF